jgi:hypothetical protein
MANSGKVIWSVTMSLDGFIAGPNDEMEWCFSSQTLILSSTT